jgi:hypothetical protein
MRVESTGADLSEVVWLPYQFGPGAADRGAFTDSPEGAQRFRDLRFRACLGEGPGGT